MPLGRQFRDTYYHDPETGDVRKFVDPSHYANEGMPQNKPLTNEGLQPKNGLQGMLFSPYDATGLRQDSLVHDRQESIGHALHLEDADLYRQRLGSMVRGQRSVKHVTNDSGEVQKVVTSKRGERGVRDDIGRITNALDRTDMPTHVIKKVNAPTVLDPNEGRAYAEDYSNRIRLTTNVRKVREQVPGETKTVPKYKSGEPIINKSYQSAVNRRNWWTHEGSHADMVSSGASFVHADTGEPLNLDPDLRKDDDIHFRDPEVRANVWSGHTESNDKYVVNNFMVDDEDRQLKFHTRHKAVPTGETEEVTTPDTWKEKSIRDTSSATLTHEIGHTQDEKTKDRFSHRNVRGHTADPVEEGLADAFADRYVRHAGDYEETLHSSPERSAEIAGRPGYGTEYHHWKNDSVSKALYASARSHSAMSDKAHQDIPSRDALSRQFNIERPVLGSSPSEKRSASKEVDALLLGHMYDTHSHVRDTLEHLGLSDVGKKAQEKYLAAQKPTSQQWEQLTFPT